MIIPFDNCNSHYNETNEEQITKQIYTLKKNEVILHCLFVRSVYYYIYIYKGMEKSVYRSVLIFLISIGIDFHSNVSFLS